MKPACAYLGAARTCDGGLAGRGVFVCGIVCHSAAVALCL